MSDEESVKQILIYEIDNMSNQLTGFIMSADSKDDVKAKLESEDFSTAYYQVCETGDTVSIKNKQMLESYCAS